MSPSPALLQLLAAIMCTKCGLPRCHKAFSPWPSVCECQPEDVQP